MPQVNTPTDAYQIVHVSAFNSNVGSTAPAGATTRASVPAGMSLLVSDRFQSRPSSTPTSPATTASAPLAGAHLTVALVSRDTTARYGYGAHNDNPQVVRDGGNTISDRYLTLPGNALYTQTTAGDRYSHANLHGDTITVTDGARNRVWSGFTGPYGESNTAAPSNTAVEGAVFGWHGQQQRITDRSVVHMGARPYLPAHGRFLAVDPIEGGCANDYTYVDGDPVNADDVTGRQIGDWIRDRVAATTRFICGDNTFNRAVNVLSVIPPTATTFRFSNREDAAGFAAKSNATIWRLAAGQAAQLLPDVRGAGAIRAAGRLSLGLTIWASGYDLGRLVLC